MKASSQRFLSVIRILAIIGVAGILFGFVAFQVGSDPKKVIRVPERTGTKSVNAKALSFYLDTGKFPESIDELLTNIRQLQNWKGPYVTEQQSRESWGHRYIIHTPGEHSEIHVISLGADGLVGGVGRNADVGSWEHQ